MADFNCPIGLFTLFGRRITPTIHANIQEDPINKQPAKPVPPKPVSAKLVPEKPLPAIPEQPTSYTLVAYEIDYGNHVQFSHLNAAS